MKIEIINNKWLSNNCAVTIIRGCWNYLGKCYIQPRCNDRDILKVSTRLRHKTSRYCICFPDDDFFFAIVSTVWQLEKILDIYKIKNKKVNTIEQGTFGINSTYYFTVDYYNIHSNLRVRLFDRHGLIMLISDVTNNAVISGLFKLCGEENNK